MISNSFLFTPLLFLSITSCSDFSQTPRASFGDNDNRKQEKAIKDISLPDGFSYINQGDSVYANWLLGLHCKKNKTVYLYNGAPKPNQDVQFAVLDIDIGKKDLIQCADAAMKLRADFLFDRHRYTEIKFISTSGDELSFDRWLKGTRWKEQNGRLISFTTLANQLNAEEVYRSFMEMVFSYCGTYSLSKQLATVNDIKSIQPGDVFVQGGFPGHAVTVMAVAKNNDDKKIFLLSQGYMPAQDIHILKNYTDPGSNPWYSLSEIYPLNTPQWRFERGSLRRW